MNMHEIKSHISCDHIQTCLILYNGNQYQYTRATRPRKVILQPAGHRSKNDTQYPDGPLTRKTKGRVNDQCKQVSV